MARRPTAVDVLRDPADLCFGNRATATLGPVGFHRSSWLELFMAEHSGNITVQINLPLPSLPLLALHLRWLPSGQCVKNLSNSEHG